MKYVIGWSLVVMLLIWGGVRPDVAVYVATAATVMVAFSSWYERRSQR